MLVIWLYDFENLLHWLRCPQLEWICILNTLRVCEKNVRFTGLKSKQNRSIALKHWELFYKSQGTVTHMEGKSKGWERKWKGNVCLFISHFSPIQFKFLCLRGHSNNTWHFFWPILDPPASFLYVLFGDTVATPPP